MTVRDNELPKVKIKAVGSKRAPLSEKPYSNIDVPPRREEGQTMYLFLERRVAGPELTINLEGTGANHFIDHTAPTSAVIRQGQKTSIIDIATDNDQIRDETANFTLKVLDGTGYRPGNPGTATFTIEDNNSNLPVVGIKANRVWVNEGEDVVFTVTRHDEADAGLDLDVTLFFTQGGSTQQEDIMVNIPAGTDAVTITRSPVDDSKNLGDSKYVALITTNVGLPGQDADDNSIHADTWIQDDGRNTVTLTPQAAEYDEGDSMTVTLTRSGDTSRDLRIDAYMEFIRRHPTQGQDSTFTSHWPFGLIERGDSSRTQNYRSTGRVDALGATGRIWLVPDNCPDGSSDCAVHVPPHYCPDSPGSFGCGFGSQYQQGSQYEQTFTVYNDTMGVRIEADQTSVSEGTAATFTLERHGGRTNSLANPSHVNVQLTQDGEYISGAAQTTVTFPANVSTTTLTDLTDDDGVDEQDGSITATLLPPTNTADDDYNYAIGEYAGTPLAVTTVTPGVTDDDYVPSTVSVQDGSGKENDGTIECTVSLDQPNNEVTSSVDWATAEDGTDAEATSGTDFTAASGTLDFAIGGTEKTVRVTLLDDDMDENHETFALVLSNLVNLTLGSDGAGTILDHELAFAVIFAQEAGTNVVEGEYLNQSQGEMRRWWGSNGGAGAFSKYG